MVGCKVEVSDGVNRFILGVKLNKYGLLGTSGVSPVVLYSIHVPLVHDSNYVFTLSLCV